LLEKTALARNRRSENPKHDALAVASFSFDESSPHEQHIAIAYCSSTQKTHLHGAAMVIHNNKKPVANHFATGLFSPGICPHAPPHSASFKR